MQREKVKVEKRTVLGKQVRKLRREGLFPANIYGKEFESTSVQLSLKEFTQLFKKVGETGLIDVHLNGQVIPALIHNVQRNPLSQEPIHADFYKVNLKEKIKASVPLVALGEPQAVVDKKGVLLSLIAEVEVEALPADLPEKIEVNVEKLAEVDEQLSIADIKVSTDVSVLNDPSQVVFKIGKLVTKEAEEEAKAAEAAAAATEAQAVAEGAQPETSAQKEEAQETTESKPAEPK